MDAGALPEAPLDSLPPVMILDHLDAADVRFDRMPELAHARREGAAWMREDVEGRAGLGRDLVAVEGLLAEALEPTGPSLVDMGVEAWDRQGGLIDPETPLPGEGVRRRMHRMLQPMTLEQLQEEDPVERLATPDPDPGAWRRAADLIEAIQRLSGHLSGEISPALREALSALQARLGQQLRRERAHDATLDRRLDEAALSNSALPGHLRRRVTAYFDSGRFDAGGAVVAVVPGSSPDNPYLQAIEAAFAEEQREVEEAPLDQAALYAVRQQAQRAAAKALAAEGEAQAGFVADLDRLLAQEVSMTQGRPWLGAAEGPEVDTLALRRAVAHLPRQAPTVAAGAAAWSPKPALPEIPVLGADGAVIGVLRAGDRVSGALADGRLRVDLGEASGEIDARWLTRADEASDPWPTPPSGRFQPAYSAPQRQPLGAAPAPVMPALDPDLQLTVAQEAAPTQDPTVAPARAAARGPGAAAPTPTGPALRIGAVQAQGLAGPDGAEARPILERAMAHLEHALATRLQSRPALAKALTQREASLSQVDVPITVHVGAPIEQQAQRLAGEIAEALIRQAQGAVQR